MLKKTELIAKIDVVDGAGNDHTVDEYQSFSFVTFKDGTHDKVAGTRSFKLGEQPVNYIDEETFEIAATGDTLTRT